MEQIAVYGAGAIGAGLATLLVGNSRPVVVLGNSESGLVRCRKTVEDNWNALIEQGYATEHNKCAAMKLLTLIADPAALAGCTFVFEAVKEDVSVKNHAKNGRSTKSFIDEGRLNKIDEEIQAGDFLFIQFGHNDEKTEDPTRYTEPFSTYMENLKKYIEVARKHCAYPVLITPLERRCFVDEKHLGIGAHSDYVAAMKQTAEQCNVPLVDLYSMSRNELKRAGELASRKWYMYFDKDEYDNFIEALNQSKKPVWIRQVIVPGMMDNEDYLNLLEEELNKINNIQKIEFLPYHNIGVEKYNDLGIKYPYENLEAMDKEACQELYKKFIKKINKD